MSRFYLKNNQVISHPEDIREKEQLNDFAINIAKSANENAYNQNNNTNNDTTNNTINNNDNSDKTD